MFDTLDLKTSLLLANLFSRPHPRFIELVALIEPLINGILLYFLCSVLLLQATLQLRLHLIEVLLNLPVNVLLGPLEANIILAQARD